VFALSLLFMHDEVARSRDRRNVEQLVAAHREEQSRLEREALIALMTKTEDNDAV
jgi:hypothetical protein